MTRSRQLVEDLPGIYVGDEYAAMLRRRRPVMSHRLAGKAGQQL
jgi:hypothetical protein